MAKGFRGKYFSLQAITATVSEVKLSATQCAIQPLYHSVDHGRDADSEDDPPSDWLEPSSMPLTIEEPCYRRCQRQALHCNCIFRLRTSQALHLYTLTKPAPCRCRHRKTGLAPPF